MKVNQVNKVIIMEGGTNKNLVMKQMFCKYPCNMVILTLTPQEVRRLAVARQRLVSGCDVVVMVMAVSLE